MTPWVLLLRSADFVVEKRAAVAGKLRLGRGERRLFGEEENGEQRLFGEEENGEQRLEMKN